MATKVQTQPALQLNLQKQLSGRTTPLMSPMVSPLEHPGKNVMGGIHSGLDSPATPLDSPVTAKGKQAKANAKKAVFVPTGPVVDYAMLRRQHASTIQYVIAKLRWEQANNGYIRGEKAWMIHNRVIADMEAELSMVEDAQEGLDQFSSFAFAPFAKPESHGPLTHEQQLKKEEDAKKRLAERDAFLDKQFPFIKQLFIGPRTKQQARYDRLLRDRLEVGNVDDITQLLPTENLDMAMGEGKYRSKKKNYWELRMERDKNVIAGFQEAKEDQAAKAAAKQGKKLEGRIGPLTKEEYNISHPPASSRPKDETSLPKQRELRHIALTYLRQPWPVYNAKAAPMLEQFARFAMHQLNEQAASKAPEERSRRGSKPPAPSQKEKEKKASHATPKSQDAGKRSGQ